MSRENITIVEIAKLAGTSHATVSRILANNGYPVSAELRERVMKVVQEYHYTPNMSGRLLKQEMSPDIGIIVPNYDNPYYSMIITELEKRLINSNTSLLVMSTQNDELIERKVIDRMIGKRMRAIVLLEGIKNEQNIAIIQQKGIRLIVLNYPNRVKGSMCIDTDTAYSSEMVVDYLYQLGHRRIGCVSSPVSVSSVSCMRYIQGITDSLRRHGMIAEVECTLDEKIERENLYSYEVGRIMTRQLILRKPGITAIIASNDIMAIGSMAMLREMNIRVPEDISVVGHDDIAMSRMVTPTLTTIREPYEEIVESIIRNLGERVDGNKNESIEIIRSRLIVRGSTNIPENKELA